MPKTVSMPLAASSATMYCPMDWCSSLMRRKYMKVSPLVQRISGEGADAWLTHYEASAARDRGEDVIILSVGDPDLDTPPAVVEKAVERLRAGDTHYSPAAGRPSVRQAIAAYHSQR